MKFTLEDALNISADGSVWVTFFPRTDEVWAVTGRTVNERHPEKITLEITRYNTRGTPAAESYITPAQFDKVAAWGMAADDGIKEPEPVEAEPVVMPKREKSPDVMPSVKKTATRMPRTHK
jgi:hypothetical protein